MKKILILITALLMASSSYAALTANNIPRTKTGGSSPSLQDSVIFTDGTNIGIGTTAPSQKLYVSGIVQATAFSGSAASLTAIPASNVSGVIPIANLATGTPSGLKFVRDDGTLAVPAGGSGSQWTTTASDIYYASGNVGVGTNLPTSRFQVFGLGDNYLTANVGIGSLAPTSALDVVGTVKSTGLQVSGISGSTQCIHVDTNGIFSGTGADCGAGGGGSSQWTTIGSDIYYSTGNVGIGTSTATTPLRVIGDAAITGNLIFQGTTLSGLTGSSATLVTGISPTITTPRINNVVGGTSASSSLNLQSTAAAGTTDFIRMIVGNVGATEALRVITTGNVGIGTIVPKSTLEVKGTFRMIGAATSPWTVKSGANTACDTTCNLSQCAFGQDAGSSNVVVACSSATADTCVCMGP